MVSGAPSAREDRTDDVRSLLRRMPGAPPVERTQFDRADDVHSLVPRVLQVTAALGWRLLVVVAAL